MKVYLAWRIILGKDESPYDILAICSSKDQAINKIIERATDDGYIKMINTNVVEFHLDYKSCVIFSDTDKMAYKSDVGQIAYVIDAREVESGGVR